MNVDRVTSDTIAFYFNDEDCSAETGNEALNKRLQLVHDSDVIHEAIVENINYPDFIRKMSGFSKERVRLERAYDNEHYINLGQLADQGLDAEIGRIIGDQIRDYIARLSKEI